LTDYIDLYRKKTKQYNNHTTAESNTDRVHHHEEDDKRKVSRIGTAVTEQSLDEKSKKLSSSIGWAL
jgi:hypothetical protein